jgi:uncharacterized iron-regulated membrane protein
VIGLSGSILVFRSELEKPAKPHFSAGGQGARLKIEDVVGKLRSAFSRTHLVTLRSPISTREWFEAVVFADGRRQILAIDPSSGQTIILPAHRRNWVDVLADLHATLLIGRKGRMINGGLGGLLFLINVTGMVIWWPGTKLWKRGLTVDLRRGWRRINFDLHKALGFWTLLMVSMWAITAVYFGWPKEMFRWVNNLSPVISAKPPVVSVGQPQKDQAFDLATVIESSRKLDPGTSLVELDFPYSRRAPFEVIMQRAQGSGREYTDTLYFHPVDGSYITSWRYGVNESWGDWFIWLQVPIHFGTYWGTGIKWLWAMFGMSLPVLSITGGLMYWNRVLRHKRLFVARSQTRDLLRGRNDMPSPTHVSGR